MIKITDEYLEDEVRDGFYIPSISKRAFAAELLLLDELNRICDKYNIEYFADWGTLLGAVRHKGFIPWDDDIDVVMHRNELNRFLEAAEKELKEGYKISSFKNNDYSWKFIVNIVNTERMNFTPEYLKDNFNFPYIATIDIFVLDNVSSDKEEEKDKKAFIKLLLEIADAIDRGEENRTEYRNAYTALKKALNLPDLSGLTDIEKKRILYSKAQEIMSRANNEDTEYIAQYIPWFVYHDRKLLKSDYEKSVKVPFENTYIRVPLKYMSLLTSKYGMFQKPVQGAGGHDYPYFKAQKAELGLSEDEDYVLTYKFNRASFLIPDKRNEMIKSVEEYKNSDTYDGSFDRKAVVFMPFKADHWEALKPFYEEEMKKPDTDVFVYPLPYYYKEYNGRLIDEPVYDLLSYPEELPVYPLEALDIENMFPDRIYIENPYDEYNMCTSIHPEFYSSKLKV